MRLVFVSAHYRNQPEVEAFARHLADVAGSENVHYELLVADNSRDWRPGNEMPPRLTIVPVERNLGYLNGCHRALAATSLDSDSDLDWIVVCNTDVEFDREFFPELAGLSRDDDVGLVAPRIVRADSSEMNPFIERRPWGMRLALYSLAFRYGWTLRLLDALHAVRSRGRVHDVRRRDIYAPHGSVVLVRPSFLVEGGRLDYPAFLYGEEIHLAEQARRVGCRVVYEPRLRVSHRSGTVTSRVARDQRRRWKLESMRFLRRTYFAASDDAVWCPTEMQESGK